MFDKSNSPLRQRMIDDMTARRFKEKVQFDYMRHFESFVDFLGRSPDDATSEDVRRFRLHLAKQPFGVPTVNAAISAPRFLFNITLERPELARALNPLHQRHKVPILLSRDEILHLIEAAPGHQYKAAFGVAYGAGL